MSRVIAIIGVLLCVLVSAIPSYGRRGVRGTLAVRLRVDRGGPPGRKPAPVRIKLLLVVKTLPGMTIAKTEGYALSGHTFSYVLPPGQYRVSATALPPVVNPTGRPCKSTSPTVRVLVGRRVETSVRCTLIG